MHFFRESVKYDYIRDEQDSNDGIILLNQFLQLCTARTAWSDLDQAVQTVHSCNSW